jgi:D-alanyl-D-alanine carboxypeptidase
MRKNFAVSGRVLLALVVCALTVALAGVATSGAAKPSAKQPAYAAKLRAEMPALLKESAIPGAVVLVESPGKGNWSGTFGTAVLGKRVPMKIGDLFRVGSNTKTMTATVILQLVEEGKLKLKDPISKFEKGVPNGQNISIQQLAEMRSGLFSYSFDPGFNKTLDTQPKKAWKPQELLKIAFKHKNNFRPGAKFEYSNTNIILLGLVIEKLTGETATEAFHERLFAPLGLKHTLLPELDDASIPGPHAQGYMFGTNTSTIDSYALPESEQAGALEGTVKPNLYTDDNPSWAWTAGSAISTPHELATYARALGTGKGLLSPKMQKVRMNSIRPLAPGAPVGYGIGIAQFAPGIIGHDGQVPGFSSFMAYDSKTGDVIIIAVNLSASPVTGENAAVEVAKGVLATLYGSRVVPKSNPAGDPAAE